MFFKHLSLSMMECLSRMQQPRFCGRQKDGRNALNGRPASVEYHIASVLAKYRYDYTILV
jgi:hypothetical protein